MERRRRELRVISARFKKISYLAFVKLRLLSKFLTILINVLLLHGCIVYMFGFYSYKRIVYYSNIFS